MEPGESVLHKRVCAFCEYSLAGLPVEHQCPECGHAYDAYSMLIRLRGAASGGWFSHVFRSLFVLFVAWMLLRDEIDMPVWGRALGMLATAMFLFFDWQHRIGRHGWGDLAFVLNRSGLQYGQIGSPSVTLPWDQIEKATYNMWFGWFRVRGTNGRMLLRLNVSDLGSSRMAMACVREINRAKRIYTGSS